VVLCHGFPSGHGSGPKSAHTYPQLADRLAHDVDSVVLAFNFRGCRPSGGRFSMAGWRNDIRAAVGDLAARPDVTGVAAVGFGTGGALCVCAAADDDRVRAVAAVGAPADFADWARSPRQLAEHADGLGLFGDQGIPQAFDEWARDLRSTRAVACAERMGTRPLLVLHGAEDELVPVLDARALADAHAGAELKIVPGAGHQLRHDPRGVALLLGWLDRQRSELQADPLGSASGTE
jgi:putative redox protein